MANKKALYSFTLKFQSAKQLSNFLSSQLPYLCEIKDHSVVKTPKGRHKAKKTTKPVPTVPPRPAI